ncbi:MAG: hypothetical protein GY779_13030, partial [Gammaproteobacteria bacterium]|nr:hypothetical protein [Gammaproteobacteria bacterium]
MNRPVYAEEHAVVTSKLGLFNLHIGAGDVLEGQMKDIDWGSSSHYISVQMDVENTGNFQEMGTSQLLTVPYAFYAEKSGSSEEDGSRADPDDWTINGNAGTTAGTNFLGTTDAQDLVFKTNSVEVGRFTTTGNLDLSAGNAITIGGANALNMDGTNNVFIGDDAGSSLTSGAANSFIGTGAGENITTGSFNLFTGFRSGRANTTGSNNAFIGNLAGKSNTSASANLFLGSWAGFSNTTGSGNSFIGYRAGYSSNGSENVIIGYQAGQGNTSGTRNVAVGYRSGFSNTVGNRNVFIGDQADGIGTLTNATAIGADALVTQSNSVVLGNAANVGIGTSAPTDKLHVEGSIRMVDGNEATGFIPVSDADGVMTWTDPASISTASIFELHGDTVRLDTNVVDISVANFVFGSPQLDHDGISSHENKMFFD